MVVQRNIRKLILRITISLYSSYCLESLTYSATGLYPFNGALVENICISHWPLVQQSHNNEVRVTGHPSTSRCAVAPPCDRRPSTDRRPTESCTDTCRTSTTIRTHSAVRHSTSRTALEIPGHSSHPTVHTSHAYTPNSRSVIQQTSSSSSSSSSLLLIKHL